MLKIAGCRKGTARTEVYENIVCYPLDLLSGVSGGFLVAM
jgi:hypothetical protein